MLTREHGLRVIAPDAPGHGRSPALPSGSYRPSVLAEVGLSLLSELGVARAAFVGFSWGGRVACSFAARFPDRTASLVLIEGGYFNSRSLTNGDARVDLEACIAEAHQETDEDSFASWDAYFAFERDSLRRWTPALAEAHRAMMREADGKVAPILEPEILAAIKHGGRLEPVTETYPLIAAANVPVLLVAAPESEPTAGAAIARFRSALPEARVESLPGGIHDLVSSAPVEVAGLVGGFASTHGRDQPPP